MNLADLLLAEGQPPEAPPQMNWGDVLANIKKAFTENPHQDQLLRSIGAGAASAADPFGIPSAVAGVMSPETRDSWLHLQGIQTAEQLAELSDSIVQGLGRDAAKWRKQAKEFLKRT